MEGRVIKPGFFSQETFSWVESAAFRPVDFFGNLFLYRNDYQEEVVV